MTKPDSKAVLWHNVSTLMKVRYGKENLTKMAAEATIGPATASRIKDQQTSVGIGVLDSLATLFKVEPWQLLVPKFNPASRASPHWPFPNLDPKEVRELPEEALGKIEAYIQSKIDDHRDQVNTKRA